MTKDTPDKEQIKNLCLEYNVPFSIDTFLNLVIFAARNLGYLDRTINQKPLHKLSNDILIASSVQSRGQIDKLNNLIGTLATIFHYLKTTLNDLLLYRNFIDLMVKYIGQRDSHFKEEIETEKAIFISMVYEPMKWYHFFGKYEADMQVEAVFYNFKEYDLPNLRTLRSFVLNYLNDECSEKLKVIIRRDSLKAKHDSNLIISDRKSPSQVANRLLTWLNDKSGRLELVDYNAVMSDQLDDVKDVILPIFSKVL